MSIRVTSALREDLAEAAKQLNLSEHDTMRIAMQLGIKHFRAIDYDLAGAVIAQSNILQKPQSPAVNSGNAHTAVLPTNIMPMQPQSIAADADANNIDLPQAQRVTYTSGARKKKGS
jgi:hypothetical protein